MEIYSDQHNYLPSFVKYGSEQQIYAVLEQIVIEVLI